MRCQPFVLGHAGSAVGSTRPWKSRARNSWTRHEESDVLRVAAAVRPSKTRRPARVALVPAAANAASAADASFPEERSSGRFLPSLPSKAQQLLHSRHDRDIFNLAVPALFSLMLDPIMSVTDTGTQSHLPHIHLDRKCMHVQVQAPNSSR